MNKKPLQGCSIAALLLSLLPLAALLPSRCNFSVPDGVRTLWACANIVFVLLGLSLSLLCVRSKESRSAINVAAAAVSSFWLLLMAALLALALILPLR